MTIPLVRHTSYDELRSLIETEGCHPALGPIGKGMNIEQNPHELATFLCANPNIRNVLEIGTGYKAGLARFLVEIMGWQVTTLDVQDYGHRDRYPHIRFEFASDFWKPDDLYDLVIIDGDHRYESVKWDYRNYGALADLIVFHDIAGLRDCAGAAQLWRDIAYTPDGRLRKNHYEVIADDEQRAGIGWIIRL